MTNNLKVKAAATILALNLLKMRKKKKKVWVKDWFKRRDDLGFGSKLFMELRSEDQNCYRNFVRLVPEDFDFLLEKVTPFIEKRDTNWRPAISTTIRLCLTLRYLATGDSYHSLMYLFRIGFTTITEIIPECLEAIYKVLKVHLKVRRHTHSSFSHLFKKKIRIHLRRYVSQFQLKFKNSDKLSGSVDMSESSGFSFSLVVGSADFSESFGFSLSVFGGCGC